MEPVETCQGARSATFANVLQDRTNLLVCRLGVRDKIRESGGPMKGEVAAEIVESLKEAGVDFVATLTEANLHDLVMALGEDKAIHHVPVTREEEGIGICAGAYLGGKRPARSEARRVGKEGIH